MTIAPKITDSFVPIDTQTVVGYPMGAPTVIIEDKRSSVKEYEPFQPILDRILIRRIEAVQPADGFEVPEKYRQNSNWGEVVAVGQGVMLGHEFVDIHDFVNVGDKVRYSEYCAEKFSLDDDNLWIVRLQDVRGVQRLKKTNQEWAKNNMPPCSTVDHIVANGNI